MVVKKAVDHSEIPVSLHFCPLHYCVMSTSSNGSEDDIIYIKHVPCRNVLDCLKGQEDIHFGYISESEISLEHAPSLLIGFDKDDIFLEDWFFYFCF